MAFEQSVPVKEEIIQRGVKAPPLLPQVLFAVVIFAGLVLLRELDYLLFHTAVELFSIAVIWAVFILVWNLKFIVENNYLLFLGIGLVFVSIFDFVHTITFAGMNVLPVTGANTSTQMWIIARYLESLTLFLTVVFIGVRVRIRFLVLFYAIATVVLFLSVFVWNVFPVCYIDAEGRLSTFKIVSEIVVCSVFLASIALLVVRRRYFDRDVLALLVASIACKITAELCFTLYLSVIDIFNVIGHFLKFVSFYLLYYALVRSSIIRSYNAIFRELSESELRLMAEKEKLTEALANIKTLSGLLPICSNCKRVRDDQGYWSKIEEYVASHSATQFSHGLCPDCAKSLYPDLVDSNIDRL